MVAVSIRKNCFEISKHATCSLFSCCGNQIDPISPIKVTYDRMYQNVFETTENTGSTEGYLIDERFFFVSSVFSVVKHPSQQNLIF